MINKNAAEFFRENPNAKYWYYSASLRVPNPALRKRPDWVPEPWPKQG